MSAPLRKRTIDEQGKKRECVSDLEGQDSGDTGITQWHNKPLDPVCCEPDKGTEQKMACCWRSTAVEVNEERIVSKG